THSTISRDVAAISAAHLDEGLDDPTAHHGVRRALRSVGRALGTHPPRRPPPLTPPLMRRLFDAWADLQTAMASLDVRIPLPRPAPMKARRTPPPTRGSAGPPAPPAGPWDFTVPSGNASDDRPDASDHRRDGRP